MMQQCVRKFIENEEHSALLLIDIGAWPFHDLLEKYPSRAKNIGVFEPGTISVAAGLANLGIVPIVYGISPFISQRSLEQLKLDFAYQKLGGNFLVTGASYDFSTLGYSHYCPEEFATLRLIPGIQYVAPGTPEQFKSIWNSCHNNGVPTYYRMTDHCNNTNVNVEFGKASVVKTGTKATIIAVAETLDMVIEACKDIDVTILYYTTLAPFDTKTLRENCSNGKIVVVSPFYKGSFDADIVNALDGESVMIKECAVPLEILRNYGSKYDNDEYCGLTINNIKNTVEDIV